MNLIVDPLFGSLSYDYSLHRDDYELFLWGKNQVTALRLQADEEDEITENQRAAFVEFEKSKETILKAVEESIFEYYLEHVEEYRSSNEGKEDDVAPIVKSSVELDKLLKLTDIKIMYSSNSDVRKVGFIFDALFDSELGIGVLLKNESVDEVSVQDIVLG